MMCGSSNPVMMRSVTKYLFRDVSYFTNNSSPYVHNAVVNFEGLRDLECYDTIAKEVIKSWVLSSKRKRDRKLHTLFFLSLYRLLPGNSYLADTHFRYGDPPYLLNNGKDRPSLTCSEYSIESWTCDEPAECRMENVKLMVVVNDVH